MAGNRAVTGADTPDQHGRGADATARPRTAGEATLDGFAHASAVNAWLYEKFRDDVHGDVLEIGSGIGNLSRFILRDANRVVLTDVEPAYMAALRREWGAEPRAQIVRWDLNEPAPAVLTADGPRFDAIVAVNVLEHLRDDLSVVRTLATLLRPGGRLLVYVPACPWAFGSLDRALGHHRRYTAPRLQALLQAAGLDSPVPRYMNRLGLLGWWVSTRVLKSTVLSPRAIAMFDRVVVAARAIDVLLASVPAGLGLIVRARKPGATDRRGGVTPV